jgi:hypothetical protein
MGCDCKTWAASVSCLLASNSPEAWMILARFSRSDSACLAMARCISCGRSTAFTATWVTFTPQGSVCSSMTFWSISANRSRSESSSSRWAWPRTLRRVVWAIWLVA